MKTMNERCKIRIGWQSILIIVGTVKKLAILQRRAPVAHRNGESE